jgi:hypothetical protein
MLKLLFLSLLLLAACDGGGGHPLGHLETAQLVVGPLQFTCWVAKTPEARQVGLMPVRSLGPDQGMLFVFPTESVVFFWMRDTVVPIDLCYLANDGTILDVLQMTPLDETPRPSSTPVALALEIPAGVLAANGLGVGDQVVIPPGVTDGSE